MREIKPGMITVLLLIPELMLYNLYCSLFDLEGAVLKKSVMDTTRAISHSEDFVALCQKAKKLVDEIEAEDVLNCSDQSDIFIIDVRDRDEIEKQGYLSGAYHISKGWIEAQIHLVVENKNSKIMLYCGSGKRSLLAALSLQNMGYQNVKSMKGGFKGWKQKAFPVSVL